MNKPNTPNPKKVKNNSSFGIISVSMAGVVILLTLTLIFITTFTWDAYIAYFPENTLVVDILRQVHIFIVGCINPLFWFIGITSAIIGLIKKGNKNALPIIGLVLNIMLICIEISAMYYFHVGINK
jgi:hypothetical protein